MATKPGSRQLSWLPNNLFDTGGMPAWLATAFDTDERRAEFTRWMGDMFTQWTRGQNVSTEANAASVTANQRRFMAQPATGRYFSQRQLEEVFNPGDRADRLERLRFHGGMANGKWTNDYDTWKAASKNGHGTNSRGEEIKTGSFGFSVETARDRAARAAGFNRGFFADHAVESAWAREKAATAGGDRRGVRLGEDGSLELHFGDTGVKTDVTAGRSATANAARRRMEILTNTDPQNGPWLFNGSKTDFSDRSKFADAFAASKGGESGRVSMFAAPTNRFDWAVERERAWDRSMDRADRTIADVVSSWRGLDQGTDVGFQPNLSDDLMRSSWWDDNRTRQLSNPLYQMPPRAASKGGEAMRERGWLDAVFNGGLTRAALRGGRAGK